jgi:chemosensory pili system protein ChpA (sensor histidine kinase/response regulator)
VPALMVVTPSLVVRAGDQTVALPLAQVRRVVRVASEELIQVGDTLLLQVDETTAPVRFLSESLQTHGEVTELPPTVLVVTVAVGDRLIPVIVDDIVGQHEAVVSPPAPPFEVIPGLAGTTIQGNGDVLLVLNVLELFGDSVDRAQRFTGPVSSIPNDEPLRPPTVLVVDDSLSVRRVVSRALSKHGWQVKEARDGVQALAMVPTVSPDVILLDVEMPRMDGYEVTSTLKRQPEYRDIPIVMLTSRGGDRHRQKAAELGVDAYLVKPYQETTLLRVLREVALSAPRGES